jgi:hypothetical protein
MSDASYFREWRGPNLMNASTDIRNVLRYIREELDKPWLQSVDLHIMGFCSDHFCAEPVWRQVAAFHANANSSSSDHGYLGAVRAEILHRSSAFNTPFIQIMFCVHIPHLKSLARENERSQAERETPQKRMGY